jgi:calcineurin-like phosphoesterase family protein
MLMAEWLSAACQKTVNIHGDDHACQPSTKRTHVNMASVAEFVWPLK